MTGLVHCELFVERRGSPRIIFRGGSEAFSNMRSTIIILPVMKSHLYVRILTEYRCFMICCFMQMNRDEGPRIPWCPKELLSPQHP